MEEVSFCIEAAEESMAKTLQFTKDEFLKVRAGKAHPNMLNGIVVDYYGSSTPLSQVASINSVDARTLVIKPWEKTILGDIETAIINGDLGLNPQNDGELIRLNIPALTEERRKELVKSVRSIAENGKVGIRNARKDGNNELKTLKNDGASEDLVKSAEEDIQKLTDKYTKLIDDALTVKEEEIMTI